MIAKLFALVINPAFWMALPKIISLVELTVAKFTISDPERRRRAMEKFDSALKRANDPKAPSTKGLEKWFAQRL